MCGLGDGKRQSTHVLADEHCALASDTTFVSDAGQPVEMCDPCSGRGAAVDDAVTRRKSALDARCQRQENMELTAEEIDPNLSSMASSLACDFQEAIMIESRVCSGVVMKTAYMSFAAASLVFVLMLLLTALHS
jgi:hypothetical protein